MIKYNIYPSLLDGYQNYLDSSINWNRFWGNSDEPSKTEEEYERECFQDLLDKINRVPLDKEAADKGTAFNEIVDCIIACRKSEKMQIDKIYETTTIGTGKPFQNCVALKATYNKRTFTFPIGICKEFADYFKGAVSQVYCEGVLPTKYGDVLLYGFIDELLFDKAHDIKTTSSYTAWKYRKGWQHRVYPYCLEQQGNVIAGFEYNVLEIKGSKYSSYTEPYNYIPSKVKEELTDVCERFIEFLEAHRERITDKKIFNN